MNPATDTRKGTREYRDVKTSEKSRESVLKTAEKIRLVHITAGWKPAGSCMTWTDENYGVFFLLDGNRNGRRFKAADYLTAQQFYKTLVAKRGANRESSRPAADDRAA